MLDELVDLFFIEAIFFSPLSKRLLGIICGIAGIAVGTLVIYNGNLPFGMVIYALSAVLVFVIYRFNRSCK